MNVSQPLTYKELNDLIVERKTQLWKELCQKRFSQSPPDQLDIMESLWSYGFAIGAETAISIVNSIILKANAKPV